MEGKGVGLVTVPLLWGLNMGSENVRRALYRHANSWEIILKNEM